MKRGRQSGTRNRRDVPPTKDAAARMRIIGGRFRGRTLRYLGDPRTRPMKDRVREAVFNLLGPAVRDKRVLDLFAGTGALGLEALSRGAADAVLMEQHFPTVRCIRDNVAGLQLEASCRVIAGNTFVWKKRMNEHDWTALASRPWLVLCSPPYEFYVSRQEAMLDLLTDLHRWAPAGSLLVLEADSRFDFRLVHDFGTWDVREYPPAVVGILEIPQGETPPTDSQPEGD